jgi:hypothetical protein
LSNRIVKLFGSHINPDHIVAVAPRRAPFALTVQIILGLIGSFLCLIFLADLLAPLAFAPLVEPLLGPEAKANYRDYLQLVTSSDITLRDRFIVLNGPLIIITIFIVYLLGELVDVISKKVVVRLSNGRLVSSAMSDQDANLLVTAIEAVAKRDVQNFDGFIPSGDTISYRAGDTLGGGHYNIGNFQYTPYGFPVGSRMQTTQPFDFTLKIFIWIVTKVFQAVCIFLIYSIVAWYFYFPFFFSNRDTGPEIIAVIFMMMIPFGVLWGLFVFLRNLILGRTGVDLTVVEFDGNSVHNRVINSGGASPMGWLQNGLTDAVEKDIGFRMVKLDSLNMLDVMNSTASRNFLRKNYKVVDSPSTDAGSQ